MSHPLHKFCYCPACGSSRFEIQNGKSKQCADCGFEYFMNPSAANAAFILNDRGQLLAVRRRRSPARGTLDLPGGFCDIGETLEQGVRREVMEETGLEVTAASYLFSIPNRYSYSGMTIPTLDAFFRCRVSNADEAQPMDDAGECVWLNLADTDPADFGLESVRRAVTRFLHENGNDRT